MAELIIINKDDLEVLIQDALFKSLQKQQFNHPDEGEKFFSLSEAAKFLQLAKQTLYSFTSQRTIPFIKRGKKLYFRKSDLEKWLNEGRKKSKDEIIKSLEANDGKLV